MEKQFIMQDNLQMEMRDFVWYDAWKQIRVELIKYEE